jgi:DNA-binding PadR family transcriptional regulator
MSMNTQRILLTLVGAVVSLVLAIILVWHSKKTIAKTMSRRHILHMLKAQGMNGKELTDTAKECKSDVISPKLVPSLLVKLEEEGLVQKADNSRYVITTKGLESLKGLDAMGREFQKVAKIMQKTSMISKFMVTEAIDRVTTISSADDAMYDPEEEKTGIPLYGSDKQ